MILYDIFWENDMYDTQGMMQVFAENESDALNQVSDYSEYITTIEEADQWEYRMAEEDGLVFESPCYTR